MRTNPFHVPITNEQKSVLLLIAVDAGLDLSPAEVVNIAQFNIDKGYSFQTVVKEIKILGR